MTCLDSDVINGHWTCWWILWVSDCLVRYFRQSLSRNMWRIPILMTTWHQGRCIYQHQRDVKILSAVHLLQQSGSILTSSWTSSSFQVVANKGFCRSCGHIPHICRNAWCWTNWSVAEIPEYTNSISICNTQSSQEWSKTYFSKLCCNNSEVLGIEWIVAGISKCCSVLAKQTTTHIVIKYGSW